MDVCASFSLPVKTLHQDALLEAGQQVEAAEDALENVERLMSFLWRLLSYKQHTASLQVLLLMAVSSIGIIKVEGVDLASKFSISESSRAVVGCVQDKRV